MEQRQAQELIQIIAKAPLPGQVKTRLVPMLGAGEASELYQQMVEQVLTQAVATRPVQLWCAPDSSHPFFQACRARFGVELRTQPPGDLGERMRAALQTGLAEAERVVLVGSDCPGITTEYLNQAFDALRQREVVIGPAEDGGYVLIGMTRLIPAVFHGIPWSTGLVRERTEAILQTERVDYQLLSLLWDVDRPKDLRRWRAWPS